MSSFNMDSLLEQAQFEVTCPNCSTLILVNFEQLGKPINCEQCHTSIVLGK